MARYVLRFFFDAENCLWPDEEAAIEQYGYPAGLGSLGLSDKTIAMADEIIHRDWLMAQKAPDVYGVFYEFTAEERAAHRMDVAILLQAIRDELGAEFDIIDEQELISESDSLEESQASSVNPPETNQTADDEIMDLVAEALLLERMKKHRANR